MKENCAVEFKNVCKIYDIKRKGNKKNFVNNKINQKFYALKNVSFSIDKGEIVGILGTNGSGKSTLSSIIAGISVPTSGDAIIKGEQSLISINTGLNNQLTGIENIKVKGALLGLSKLKIEEITQGVIEFSELGDFLYQPVKSYSSGMKSRLGFAISISLDPDIIIIDEALSVGDSSFAAKCINKMEEFKQRGKTIFFVSHSLSQVKSFCNKAIWIDGGELKQYGDIDEIAQNYFQYIKNIKEKSDEEKQKFNKEIFEKRIISVEKNRSIKLFIEKLKDKTNLRKYKNRYISLVIIFIFIITTGGIGLGMNKNKSKTPISEENLIVDNQVVEKSNIMKDYSFLFFIEGEDVGEYKNSYRTYLDDKSGKTVYAITNFSITSDGKINITNIPISLQVYYDSLMIFDEIRFCDLVGQESALNIIENNIVNKKIDNVFFIKQENLKEFISNLGFELQISNNDFVFKCDGKEYQVNNSIINNDNTDNFKEIINFIFNNLIKLNNEERVVLLSKLFGNDNEQLREALNIINANSGNDININFNDFNTERVLLKEMISESDYMLLESDNLLQKEIVVLNKDDVNQNICYKALIDKIRIIKEENEQKEKQTISNDDLNNYERPSTSQNSTNGQGNVQNGSQSRPPTPPIEPEVPPVEGPSEGSEESPIEPEEPPIEPEEPPIEPEEPPIEPEEPPIGSGEPSVGLEGESESSNESTTGSDIQQEKLEE
ncbi:ABC transporter ATP-binding protein [uncultured Clostridium sp.]|uniref:ABC transporter ATP-binding protein n=2 Tax=uncultured Clostridium sp. TaxID=59620 RepID=UPI0025DD1BEF|nr:ATP-binding cassette domain-containing protein [uncultured Clostridium sp.]